MNKLVKVRKPHSCYICKSIINIGEISDYYNMKLPKFDNQGNQIGIEYSRFYICGNNHNNCFI